ncbi:MAG: NAD(P)-dependent oxidoreductase [Bacteroidota bacterium]
MSHTILLIDDFHSALQEGLVSAGFTVIDCGDCSANLETIVDLMQQHQPQGLMVRSKWFIGAEILGCTPSLQWVGRGGAGMDNIDEDAAKQLNIYCFNAGEANSDAVGEQTVAMLLAMFTRLVKSHGEIQQGIWDREGNRGLELKGKTVGILGYGNTGSAVARKLHGFGVRVIAHDKYRTGFGDASVEEVGESELLAESDVLSLHVPLTGETKNWLTEARLGHMKQTFWLLNLSRGGVLDLSLVLRELKGGRMAGFAADVLAVEPPFSGDAEFMDIFIGLLKNNRVILSPHVGGWTVESYRKISEVLLDKVLNFYDIPSA